MAAAVVLLVSVPLARQSLPPELFGVWMMLSSLMSFFSFVDLGVGNGVLNRVTAEKARSDYAALARTIVCGYACATIAALLLVAGWWVWLMLAQEPWRVVGAIDPGHRREVLVAVTCFVLLLGVSIPANLAGKMQLGVQQGYWNGLSQTLASALMLPALWMVSSAGGGLTAFVFASLGVQVAVNGFLGLVWLRRAQVLRAGLRGAFDLPTVAVIFKAGALFFILQLCAAFAFHSDAFVITQLLGPAAYGDFAIVQRLFLVLSAVLGTVLIALWPAVGDALARGDHAWVQTALWRAIAMTALWSGATCTLLAFSMPFVVERWVGPMVQVQGLVVAALAVWTVIETLGSTFAAFLNAANLIAIQAVVALVLACVAFTAKWWLVPYLGAAGSVIATIVSYLLISAPVQVYVYRRHFSRSHRP